MNYIISQILGYIALLFIAISYFCKNKTKFLTFQIIADLFYAGSYLFVNLYVAGIITLISTIRCVVFFFCEKHQFKYSFVFLPIFIIGYLMVTICFWTNYSDLIPLITGTLFTISYLLKNVQAIRYTVLIPNLMLIVYNITFKTYSNAILDILETIVIICSIITFHILSKKEKTTLDQKKEFTK